MRFPTDTVENFKQVYLSASYLQTFEAKGSPLMYLTGFVTNDDAKQKFDNGVDGRTARFASDLGESVAWGDERYDRFMLLVQKLVEERESFWTVVYSPFMDRDLTRAQLKDVVSQGLERTAGNYRLVVRLFNIHLLEGLLSPRALARLYDSGRGPDLFVLAERRP